MAKDKLPRGISLGPNGNRWVVRVGVKFLGKNSKFYTKFFNNKKDALAFITELEKKQSGDFKAAEELSITPLQMAEVRLALNRLKGKASLQEVVRIWEQKEEAFQKSPIIEEAIQLLLAAKIQFRGVGVRYQKDLPEILTGTFKKHLKERIDSIDSGIMEKLITAPDGKDGKGGKPSVSRKAKRIRYANTLFNYALKQRWIPVSPLVAIEKPTVILDLPAVLTPVEVAKLLHTAEKLFPKMAPMIAIKVFSGIRNDELLKIPWKAVEENEIMVTASYGKNGRARRITIPDVLASWLHDKRGKDDEKVFDLRPNRINRQMAWYKEMDAIEEHSGVKLPQNVLRHVFGTYHYALYGDATLTSKEMGNSLATVEKHYINVTKVKKKDAALFWNLTPARVEVIMSSPPTSSSASALPPEEPEPEKWVRSAEDLEPDENPVFHPTPTDTSQE